MKIERQQSIKNIADKINDLVDELDSLYEEEQDYHDNVPDNLQTSERYRRSEDACDVLSEAVSDIRSSVEALIEIT